MTTYGGFELRIWYGAFHAVLVEWKDGWKMERYLTERLELCDNFGEAAMNDKDSLKQLIDRYHGKPDFIV